MTSLPRRIICLFASFVWFAVAGNAAGPSVPSEYTLREWHDADGLPSEEVFGVVQDQNGYLWLGTAGVIARFDGKTFDSTKIPQFLSTRSLAWRHKGKHNTRGGLVAAAAPSAEEGADADGCYVHEDGRFRFEREPLLAGRAVRSLFGTQDGTLWLGCEDGTVLRKRDQDAAVFAPPAGLAGKRVPLFAADAAGRLWVVIGNVLARFDGTRWQPVSLAQPEPEIRIATSAQGGLWLFTRTALLRWADGKPEEAVKLPDLLNAHFVQTVCEDRHGDLWVGTRSQGLFRISGRQILQVPTSNDDISGLCEDSEGNIWVATNGSGLNRLRPKAHRLFDQTSGLKDNFSYTVAEDTAGNIWLANRDGGMALVVNGEIDPLSRRANWRPFRAMSVCPAPTGGVWITSGIGMFRTGADDPGKVLREPSLSNVKNVRVSLAARNGDYWYSVDPDRVARWRDGKIALFGPAEGYDGREIRSLAEDPSGNIWVGAAEGKLFRTADGGDRLERVSFPGAGDFGSLQVIRFEPDGTVLIGTSRKGVLIFPGGDPRRPRSIGHGNGLPDENVTQILADDFDRHWFASRGGIFWIHRAHIRAFAEGKADVVHAVRLGRDDGLPALSCHGLFQPAAWKSRDGKLWFATRRGVLCSDPSLMPAGSTERAPPVTLSSVSADGRAGPARPEMEISAAVRKIEIRFSVLSLTAPEQIQIKYRLDGFDDDWVVSGQERVAAYPRLPPGDYVFRAMASNGNGLWNEQPPLLQISVFPRWWQSRWAQLLYLLVLLLAVAAVVRVRSHRRLRRRLRQSERDQAIERERTRIAQNIHDDVGATLTHISLLTQSAQNEAPAHSRNLEKIYDAAYSITRSLDEIVWAINPKYDDLEGLVYYLGNFAQHFLGTAGIRCRLDLPSALPPAPFTGQTRHNLFLCCKEALHNAVKHARADEVTLRITVEKTTLQILVSDNGQGLGAASPPAADTGRIAGGDGLGNMRRRMDEIGGTFTLTARPEGGTLAAFSIVLPAATV